MKLTEKELLAGYDGICRGGAKKSIINGITIYWEYRRNNDDGVGACICMPERADFISLEYDRQGNIALDDSHNDTLAIDRIVSDEEKLYGIDV